MNDESRRRETGPANNIIDSTTIPQGADRFAEERRSLAAIREARSEQMASLRIPEPYRWSVAEVSRLAAWDRVIREHPGRELPSRFRGPIVDDPFICDPSWQAA